MDNCTVSACADAGGVLIIVGSLTDVFPTAAAGLAAIWYLVQMWESQTGKGIRDRVRLWFLKRNLPNWP